MRTGVYPGTFNPPTVAHLAVAEAARAQRGLDRVVLAVSLSPIDKEHVVRPLLAHRLEVLLASVREHGEWLDVALTEHRLVVDIAQGYDVVVMGADKWAQVNDVAYYADELARDVALARLPEVAVAPRGGVAVPRPLALDVHVDLATVSSTRARSGDRALMTRAALAFDDATGAWSDPARYDAWLAGLDALDALDADGT